MALSKSDNSSVSPPVSRRPTQRRVLDISAEIEEIKRRYSEESRDTVNFLVIGPYGEGKTFGVQTAPGPVFVHSFDSGGTVCLKDAIDDGRVLVDTRFEGDSAAKPFAYRLWEKEFRRLQSGGFFDNIGTYVIDSWTTFSASIMHEILKGRGRTPRVDRMDFGRDPDIVPELSDYNVHQKTLSQWISEITALPCHVIILAHALINEDKTTGKTYSSVMMDGKKFAQMVPTMFDEVYFADSKNAGPGKREYFYRTVPQGIQKARSRMARKGILDAKEPQDIRAILKKAGFSYEDKVIPPTPIDEKNDDTA